MRVSSPSGHGSFDTTLKPVAGGSEQLTNDVRTEDNETAVCIKFPAIVAGETMFLRITVSRGEERVETDIYRR